MPEHRYPMTLELGGSHVLFRYTEPGDRDAVLALTTGLPHHDLLFLTRDMTDPEIVEQWLSEEETTRVIAILDGVVVGYFAIRPSPMPWSKHVADLRVLVSDRARGKGLGRSLMQQAFASALSQGVEKITAQMTLDQKAAISVFEGLGFRPEALLRDHVKDPDGEKHDLLILSHEVARFEAQRIAFGMAQAFEG